MMYVMVRLHESILLPGFLRDPLRECAGCYLSHFGVVVRGSHSFPHLIHERCVCRYPHTLAPSRD
jgi:hypothetical protein